MGIEQIKSMPGMKLNIFNWIVIAMIIGIIFTWATTTQTFMAYEGDLGDRAWATANLDIEEIFQNYDRKVDTIQVDTFEGASTVEQDQDYDVFERTTNSPNIIFSGIGVMVAGLAAYAIMVAKMHVVLEPLGIFGSIISLFLVLANLYVVVKFWLGTRAKG